MELKDITYTLRANLKRLPLSADASAWRSKSAWRELRQAAFAGLARLTKGKFRITAAGTRVLKALASVETGVKQAEAGEVTDGPDLEADLSQVGAESAAALAKPLDEALLAIAASDAPEYRPHAASDLDAGGGEAVPDAAPPEGNAFDLDDPLPSENNE